MTVKNNNIKAGTQIVQYDYQGLDSQKWIIRDSGKGGWIISPLSNPELAITIQGTIENGRKLVLSRTVENENQMFCLYNITSQEKTKENGNYKIVVSEDINKAIEAPGGNKENNSQLGIWDYRKCYSSKTEYRIYRWIL